ncbi:DarT ssDNA thymidine ADP-ribosyltransferase family protein [Demequina sp. SO4-13]|uniref:DarT ssDNA thymidine ADP-ribosyltransferase family protein n=1 Tax=Demequina sp. SO4-13 TaxID=3401027 RepID=UPI003AF4ADC6
MTSVEEALSSLPVTRLAHFTPASNLGGILIDGQLRAATDLSEDRVQHHAVTDEIRIDGQRDLVCCSFEYPNPFYSAIARKKSGFKNYPTWVCLLLDRELTTRSGTRFYPCNAAKGSGGHGDAGGDALLAMWKSPSPVGAYQRRTLHHPAVPTDLQAEVQVPGPVPVSAIRAIVVESAEVADEQFRWLQLCDARPERFEWRVAPLFFSRDGLAVAIQSGTPVAEIVYEPNGGAP